MTEIMYLNGEFLPIDEGRVSCQDRGFNFADGIYEVVRVYRGRPFAMREHMERLENSIVGIDMALPMPIAEFEALVHGLIGRSGHEEAVVYMQVTRGAGQRDHIYINQPALEPTVMAFARPAQRMPREWRLEGVMMLPEPDIRHAMCHIKTICLLPNILAKNRAKRLGGLDALFHLEDGTVTEGSATNVFAVRGGEVWTAPLGPRILPGITRQQILKIAPEAGIVIHEESLKLSEFEAADEVFMTGSNMEVMPVVRLGDRVVGGGKPGPVTRRVHEAYREHVRQCCGLDSLVPLV